MRFFGSCRGRRFLAIQKPSRLRFAVACSGLMFACLAGWVATVHAAEVRGPKSVWQPVTLVMAGPQASEAGEVNPFLDRRVTVEFTSGEHSVTVPAYFAADGQAAETSATSGDVWRAHFVPPTAGSWRYQVSARAGSQVALSNSPTAGEPATGDGESGSFEVANDPAAEGTLKYVGERYLRFAGSGAYFLKSGADSPENLLGYVDFDGTQRGSALEQSRGEASRGNLHRYAPHIRDWRDGDPTWQSGKGKGLIGAVNYLAGEGVNSIYFLTMNVRGDGNDVWPWTAWDERFRFDCSKLDQWEIVFSHMDRRGMALHVVLSETENESLFEHEESNQFAQRRRLYYREMVARFAHHQALVWNLGEENGWDDRENKNAPDEHWRAANTSQQRKQFAGYLRSVDPYDHPIVVHTLPGRYEEIYRPLLGDRSFDGLSLQVKLGPRIHEETVKWIAESRKAGRPWFANLDEIGPASDGVKPDADDPGHDDVRRYALWGNLMGGGSGCEWYFGYKFAHNDLNLEDFRSRQRMWEQTHHAVEFFQEHLKFWEMDSADELTKGNDVYCFRHGEETYVMYLPEGLPAVIDLPSRSYGVYWFNPRDGGSLRRGTRRLVVGGGSRSIGDPPEGGDWVALLRKQG